MTPHQNLVQVQFLLSEPRTLIFNVHLRNEFHFSDADGAMNHSGSRAK